MKLRLLPILVAVFVAGCASVKPWLWQPVPEKLVLARDLTFHNPTFERGEITLPAGDYVRWYENDFGYYYAIKEKLIIQRVGKMMQQFSGGIWLAKRGDVVLIYELSSVDKNARKTGEVAALAHWEAGDTDKLARDPKGMLPKEFRPELGLPIEQKEPK